MTIGQLREMPNDEYVGWNVYHARRAQKQELAMMQAKARG